MTLLKFDFSSCTSAGKNRVLDMNTILQWTQDPTSHAKIMKREFYTYFQSWEELSLVLLPAHSSAEAFDRADRLRKELMPSSTAMSEYIMDPLNNLVQDLNSRNCTVRVHTPSTWLTAKEHDDLNASATTSLTSTNGTSNSASSNALGRAGSTGTIGLGPKTRGNDASLNGDDPPTSSITRGMHVSVTPMRSQDTQVCRHRLPTLPPLDNSNRSLYSDASKLGHSCHWRGRFRQSSVHG